MTRRALVLGGGGITAIAWEFGLLGALAEAGIRLDDADEVLGTSAGSVVGAHLLTHADLTADGNPAGDLAAAVESDHTRLADPELGGTFSISGMLRHGPSVATALGHLERRRRIGRAAIAAVPQGGEDRVEVLRRHLDVTDWPAGNLRITAMSVETGRVDVFDKHSGVDIVRAIAASCAVPFVWPAVDIDDTPYLDGGVRSPTNADLVESPTQTSLLALVPLQLPLARHQHIGSEIERARFPRHLVIRPDEGARAAIGRRVLDPRRAEASAAAGMLQGARIAHTVRALWG